LIYKKGGHGIPKDLRKSFACFRESAESSNDSQVQYNLAKCYLYGHGVAQDLASARHWFHKSADQNQPQSMYNLGSMMMKGEGGEWLVKEGGLLVVASASAGCANAKNLLGEVERRSAQAPPSDIDKDLGVNVGLLLELI
jgi:TPR repeat protein